ncbi:hypothetical protein C8J57DRAFT_1514639 [Mycena rebaudengoi]|nr:hypothetical protein C8J57DRAFT_1514639 [Mycena rebaudengoi]
MDELVAGLTKLRVSSPPEDSSTDVPKDAHTDVRISYQPTNCDNEAWIRRWLIDAEEPILFVGESSDRSLPVALAIMRGSWNNIWAGSEYTNFRPEKQSLPGLLESSAERSSATADFLTASLQRKNRRAGYATFIHTSPRWQEATKKLRQRLRRTTNALDPSAQKAVLDRLSLVFDAENLSTFIRLKRRPPNPPPTRNIWFQCPWARDPAALAKGFIRSAAAIQKSGDVIFLGLTAHPNYQHRYKLDHLKTVAHGLGYETFMDECFIRHAIDAGYKHEGVRDIHDFILDYHQTVVFVKRTRTEHVRLLDNICKQREDLEAQLREFKARELELTLVAETMLHG